MVTLILRPSGVGATTEYTADPAVPNWQNVDEASPDSDGTHVYYYGNAADPIDVYAISPTLLAGKINSVSITVNVSYSGTVNTSWAKGVIRTHDANYAHPTWQYIIWTAGYQNLTFQWTTNPHTSTAWSWSEIYTMQIGQQTHGASSTRYIRVTQVYATIDYTIESVRSNFGMGDCMVF